MIAPRLYTERVPVRISTALRDQLQEKLADVGVAAAMRDAALCAIGRDDLVVGDGRDESGHQARRSAGEWATVGVNLTTAQKRALHSAAKAGGVALSALLCDSLLVRLRMPKRKPRARADGRGSWPLGKRKSVRPKR